MSAGHDSWLDRNWPILLVAFGICFVIFLTHYRA